MTSNTKVCSKCDIEKDHKEFNKDSRLKDGKRSSCRQCDKKWRVDNPDYHTEYRKDHREKNIEYLRQWRLNNPDYRERRLERNPDYFKNYYLENKDKYYQSGGYDIETKRRRAKRNRDRRRSDPLFRLSCIVRNAVNKAFSNMGFKKNSKTEKILGCSFTEFKEHIESKFIHGMTWENRHLWEIDHIIPISWATTEEEILQLSHFTNLNPLWREDNAIKQDRYAGDNKTILEMHEKEGVGFRFTPSGIDHYQALA